MGRLATARRIEDAVCPGHERDALQHASSLKAGAFVTSTRHHSRRFFLDIRPSPRLIVHGASDDVRPVSGVKRGKHSGKSTWTSMGTVGGGPAPAPMVGRDGVGPHPAHAARASPPPAVTFGRVGPGTPPRETRAAKAQTVPTD